MISSEDISGSISLNTNPFGKKDIYTYIGRVKLQNHHIKIICFRGGRFEAKSCRVLYCDHVFIAKQFSNLFTQ